MKNKTAGKTDKRKLAVRIVAAACALAIIASAFFMAFL